MIQRNVVHYRDPGLEKCNRTVALVHLTDKHVACADPGAGKRRVHVDEFFISAPFMIVGLLPAQCKIHPIMPTVVDLPLVPATPTPKVAPLKSWARSLARVVMATPIRRAACTSGTVCSTAVEVTKICSARRIPLPSCG